MAPPRIAFVCEHSELTKSWPCERSEQVFEPISDAHVNDGRSNSFGVRKGIADFDIVKADSPVRTTG